MDEIDFPKIERLLDKIEKDKKKQQENHTNIDAERYLDDINKAIELYSLTLDEISSHLELTGLSQCSGVLKKLFKGMRNQTFSILKFGIFYLKRTNQLIESHQAQQLQLPTLNGNGLQESPQLSFHEHSHLVKEFQPSRLILDEKPFPASIGSPNALRGDFQTFGKAHINVSSPTANSQSPNGSPRSLTTLRNGNDSPSAKVDVVNEEPAAQNGYQNGLVSLRKGSLLDMEEEEAMRKYILEHEKMQKDINEVLKGKTVLEKLAPRRISIHLKQALKGLEFTNKKVNSLADNVGDDDDDDDEHELEDPRFEEMGDRIKEAFSAAKGKAVKNMQGALRATKEGFRKNAVRGKGKAKTVKLHLKDASTMADDLVNEEELKIQKQREELNIKAAQMEEEKARNDYTNNKIATAYSLCVKDNISLKEKIAALEKDIKAMNDNLLLVIKNKSETSVKTLVVIEDKETVPIQEPPTIKSEIITPEEMPSQNQLQQQQQQQLQLQQQQQQQYQKQKTVPKEVSVPKLYAPIAPITEKRTSVEIKIAEHQLGVIGKDGNLSARQSGLAPAQYEVSMGSNIGFGSQMSSNLEDIVTIENTDKKPSKVEGQSPNNRSSAAKTMLINVANESSAMEAKNTSPATTKKEERQKTASLLDRTKSLGPGKSPAKTENIQNSTPANRNKANTPLPRSEPQTPKSSSDMRSPNKPKIEKIPLQMSQTVTDRSPLGSSKFKIGGPQTPKKSNSLMQVFPAKPLRTVSERDVTVRSSNRFSQKNSPSPDRVIERTAPKETTTSVQNLSHTRTRPHDRASSLSENKPLQSRKLEEHSAEKNLSGEESPARYNKSLASLNFQPGSTINFSKYKSQPVTSRDILGGSIREKEEMWAGLHENNADIAGGVFYKGGRDRGSKGLLESLFVNTGRITERSRTNHTGEESKDEEENYSNSIKSARLTESNTQNYKKGMKNYNSDLWGGSPKASKFRDDFDDTLGVLKISPKFDSTGSIFGRSITKRNKAIDSNRFELSEFAGNWTSRKPFDGITGSHGFNMHKHEILQIEKIKLPNAFRETDDEKTSSDIFGSSHMPLTHRRNRHNGSYTEAPKNIFYRSSQSPSGRTHADHHDTFSDAKLTRYGSVVRPARLTLEDCILMEMMREAEDPATNKEDAQMRVMYRGMLAKVKQQPKFGSYIRNLVYRGMKTGVNNEHPVVDYEVFEEFVKNYTEIHAKCGENCIHIKNFCAKIGYQTNWNNRAPMVVKRTEIGHQDNEMLNQSPRLPTITRKKKEL